VRESLRKVPEHPPAADVVFLGEQADVVAQREEPLEQRTRFLEPALKDQVVGEPEAAGEEITFAPGQAVDVMVAAVAEHEAVDGEVTLDCGQRSDDARIPGRKESRHRNQQQAGIELPRAIALNEAPEARVVAVAAHVVVDASTQRTPLPHRALYPELLDAANGAIDRDPRHHLRIREMTAPAADLP